MSGGAALDPPLAGVADLLGRHPKVAAADESPPDRLIHAAVLLHGGQHVLGDMLKAVGIVFLLGVLASALELGQVGQLEVQPFVGLGENSLSPGQRGPDAVVCRAARLLVFADQGGGQFGGPNGHHLLLLAVGYGRGALGIGTVRPARGKAGGAADDPQEATGILLG